MTPEWVGLARFIVSTRGRMEKYSDGLEDILYTFSEMFTDAPRYVSPDGAPGGFWVRSNYGEMTGGAGLLPLELESADFQDREPYIPIFPIVWTLNAALTDGGKTDQWAYLP